MRTKTVMMILENCAETISAPASLNFTFRVARDQRDDDKDDNDEDCWLDD